LIHSGPSLAAMCVRSSCTQLRDVLEQRLSEVQSQYEQQMSQLGSEAKLVSHVHFGQAISPIATHFSVAQSVVLSSVTLVRPF